MQQPIEITQANQSITASVIWLHGLGANGHDFEPVVKMLNCPHIRFVLPHAPAMPVTLNQGYVMPAWYDLYGLTADAKTDEAGLDRSADYLISLIENEVKRGIPYERIIVTGFSQGGAVALHTATRYKQTLGGVVALSTYLPLAQQLEQTKNPANQHTPWLMVHGIHDDVIQLDTAQASHAHLNVNGFNVTFETYPMAHEVCSDEIQKIESYFLQQLPIK